MMINQDLKFNISPARRIVLLMLLFVAGACITGVIASMLGSLGGARHLAMMRISAVVQDVLMLVCPAVVAAVICCRRPAALLAVDRAPGLWPAVIAVAVLIFSSPAMSVIIKWNAGLHLPESMAALEASLRAAEEAAGGAVEYLLGPDTPGNLIVSLLIVGLMAGFSEELFFRGAMLRILRTAPLSPHAAIWITAAIFSLVHFQIFGFVPRLLLGAYFGYLLVWSGSVWLPMIVHVANNSLFVVLRYTTGSGEPSLAGAEAWPAVAASVALTIAGLWMLNKMTNLSIKRV